MSLVSTSAGYYTLLNLNPADKQHHTSEVISQAYKAKSREIHPDKHAGDEKFKILFQAASEANKVLSDPVTRRTYDKAIDEADDYQSAYKKLEGICGSFSKFFSFFFLLRWHLMPQRVRSDPDSLLWTQWIKLIKNYSVK